MFINVPATSFNNDVTLLLARKIEDAQLTTIFNSEEKQVDKMSGRNFYTVSTYLEQDGQTHPQTIKVFEKPANFNAFDRVKLEGNIRITPWSTKDGKSGISIVAEKLVSATESDSKSSALPNIAK